jgi:hypothetical protein
VAEGQGNYPTLSVDFENINQIWKKEKSKYIKDNRIFAAEMFPAQQNI